MEKVRDSVAYALPILQAGYLLSIYHLLPPTIANHYNAAGVPQKFAPRAILWALVCITAATVVLLRFVRSRPEFFNLPVPRNAPGRAEQEAVAASALDWIALETALLFSFLLWWLAQQGLHPGLRSQVPFIPLMVFAVVVLGVWHISKIRKVPSS